MSTPTTIYVSLLNEGTDCWRPAEATLQDDGTYLISGRVPEGEEWEFGPGAVVNCETKTFADGAVELAAVCRAR